VLQDSQVLQECLDGVPYSHEQFEKIVHFIALLKEWNEKINLVSRKDIDQLVTKHIAESIEFAKLDCWRSAKHVMDLGTGGGLPGIPLAILYPNVQFDLLDSRQKKTRFLELVVKELDLTNVAVYWSRVEDFKTSQQYEIIFARAVSNLVQLWLWSKRLLSRDGVLITPKGRQEELKINDVKKRGGVVEFSDFKNSKFADKFLVHVRFKGKKV